MKTISIYGIADRNQFKYPRFVHDHNICETNNDKITNYIHLERMSRIKYDNTIQEHIENIFFKEKAIMPDPESVLLFVNSFVGSSFISKTGRIRFDCNNKSEDLRKAEKGYCWIQESEWNGFEIPAYSISHEIAHAFSVVSFAGGLKENSLLIAFDGGSSQGNFAAFHYKNGQLLQLESHWELSHLSKLYNDNGLTFGIMNAASGEHCSVPGKLMGYASWGEPRKDIEQWLIENNYFKEAWGDRIDFILQAKTIYNWDGNFQNNNDKLLFDIAATMQEIFRKGILNKIKQLAEKSGADYLYYSGGCALNIVTNADLITNGWFKDVFISPCCNDSGLSIGAVAYWSFLQGREVKTETPYLNNWKSQTEYTFTSEDIKQTAKQIIEEKIVAICNGNGEAGPRALGNRSILALANSKELAKYVSMDVKEREWYRPIAPVMLEKNAQLFTGKKSIHHLAKYMLLDFVILPEFREEIQGVVHTNGTSRIQIISSEKDNPFLYNLLQHLDENYKVRALINTSFNGKGEPIIQTTEDAIQSAKNMKIENLIINGKYIKL